MRIGQAQMSRRRTGGGCDTWTRFGVAAVVAAVCALGIGASGARPAGSDQVTITMLVNQPPQPGYQVLIANFERVYPNIKVEATYAPSNPVWYQLETTELAAGNAPDLLGTFPGCGTPVSVCVLAKAGELAPLVRERWVRWSVPLVTSLGKYGPGLYAFEPALTPHGMFTNDALFAKLGLKVPETFLQLLAVCRAAKADGTVAVLFAGGGVGSMNVIDGIAAATVYGPDPRWAADLKAGTASFDGSPGWHQALQRFIEMNDAGCFEPGMAGVTSSAQILAEFAQGGGLMAEANSSNKGQLDAAAPQFPYSFYPLPGGTVPGQTETYIQLGTSLSVNAHSSPANQAAARMFIDFVARPAQNALYAQVVGSLTQREFIRQELPSFMQPMAPVFANHAYVLNPTLTWWNPAVGNALLQDAIGLVTGQTTVDQVLQAMDAAWKQGPA
jgi:raffinose/stachyose/melibiose transport system substrate-binding protein